MSIFDPAPPDDAKRMLAVFRMVAAFTFITFGTMKLFNLPPLPAGATPMTPWSEAWFAGVLETYGGALILFGWLTRPVAFILAGEMAVAYFQFASPVSFWPTSNMGIPAILYCFFFLYLVFSGAGAWSVDGMIAARRDADPARKVTP